MRWTLLGVLLVAACASGGDSGSGAGPATVVVAADATTVASGASTAPPATTPGTSPVTATTAAVRPEGFATSIAIVTEADGVTCEICVWLADTADQRARGLMHVTDLGAADAMAFRYQGPHTGTFWMKNTVLPLSIAFFSPGGDFVSSFDMPPCASDTCPRYETPSDFLIAVEVPQGSLPDLGLEPGSTLELLDLACDS